MEGRGVRRLIVTGLVVGALAAWPAGMGGPTAGVAAAAEAFSVDNLPKDPKAYRAQVDKIIGTVDGLIAKLKGNKQAEAALLDLMQTRDNILREIYKVENQPDGAKWTAAQMQDSVTAMLRLLKSHYEKAAEKAG
jgi:hypothetical protein